MKDLSNSILFTKPIAHRGLWNEEITENSLTAYKNAVLNGYPIETDLYTSTDGEIFCFHDTTLKRMTGADGYIYEKTTAELKSLRLKESEQTIPTLKELLEVVDGKVPVLIEIKDQPDPTIVEKVVEALKDYKGEFAIQSFNPLYINKVRKLAPSFIRGILATNKESHLNCKKPYERYIIKNMALNFLIKPHFVSYYSGGFPLKKRKTKNKKVLCWTITDKETHEKVKPYVDNIIFEHFIPEE